MPGRGLEPPPHYWDMALNHARVNQQPLCHNDLWKAPKGVLYQVLYLTATYAVLLLFGRRFRSRCGRLCLQLRTTRPHNRAGR